MVQEALLQNHTENGFSQHEQEESGNLELAIDTLLIVGIVGAGLLSGLYFIFSFCVMWALNEQPANVAINIMNAINVTIINPIFLSVFMGTPAICMALLCIGFRSVWISSTDSPLVDWLIIAGSGVLLLFEFGVTCTINVPLNNNLAKIRVLPLETTSSSHHVEAWHRYSTTWTPWNTVRMCASMMTVICFSMALRFKK